MTCGNGRDARRPHPVGRAPAAGPHSGRVEGRTGAEAVRRAHAATAVGMRERMLSGAGAPAAAPGLSVAADAGPAAVSNGRTVVSPELVISSRVCLRLPT